MFYNKYISLRNIFIIKLITLNEMKRKETKRKREEEKKEQQRLLIIIIVIIIYEKVHFCYRYIHIQRFIIEIIIIKSY